ncbi:hypothetical protein A3H65_04225 [Candidatus Giovannonibacteria bacterium RIFCSPLOWO2_02_FULL_45_14]|uniref:General secretion pathway GspH domain-containing protein n=1 Tax=Candidatus Giovannonibacteria bacterium RIFCSPLOWO2_12_FULL_44_15 TaxID=1798364 RepID=A0A1F5Y086_9BACT|nr:MAG: hypothetical protein A3C75_02420 [Candidatus Giovannonibacteria bacterium RIFCSPHIGHO2_02_FULL_44_31]OGF76198.1 MAG: hypothetical protein A3E62_01935 [Candidatus Giovannonibacteria bacterium RIFCSPHIGHO2_12_FULL_44_29]OGF91039.1 MAG: hypothetical protein A3H65_04225 [Candidatus Giovannonibacteria bacterium RIFCSPLOWO2_02_FULL_45_14]OGF93480.1 MAG: hypothetical protein A3G54_00995 [Candidatus Giovannonibacteria bacterium RIFCSPLOWO2_12_FULL_44_15]
MNKGLTLLEILVAMAIILVLGTFAVLAFSNYSKNSLLGAARARVISEINYARSETLASENKSSWGVHFGSSQIVRFKGSSYSSSDPSNISINLPEGTTISSINLGGSSEVIFERLTGRTVNTGSIKIELTSNSMSSTTINIYASGLAE